MAAPIALLLLPGPFNGVARAAGWKVVFEDQFDGGGIDPARWASRYIYDGGKLDHLNDEQQVYRDNGNHQVKDGVLNLIARQVASSDGKTQYESGMIRSLETFRYGYFEARVRLPSARGSWAAFWLNSDYDETGRLEWPPEIDIFEYVLNGSTERPNMIHSNTTLSKGAAGDGAWQYADKRFNQKWTFFDAGKDLTVDWHVVATAWTPDSVTTFLDGERLYTRRFTWVYKDGKLAGPAHILLNLAVGGHWAGRDGIDQSKFPQQLQVDYVRVCQISDQAGAGRQCGDSQYAPDPNAFAYDPNLSIIDSVQVKQCTVPSGTVTLGSKLQVRCRFDFGNRDVSVEASLEDDMGRVVARNASSPTPAGSESGSRDVDFTLEVPATVQNGRYRVSLAVMATPPTVARRRPVPIRAHFPVLRSATELKYRIAEIVVAS